MKEKILVTGYKGFIGSRLYRVFKDSGMNVDGLEINDPFPTEKYDKIYHFGGQTLLRESYKNPYMYFKQNEDFTLKLLEKCRQDDSQFFFPSSGSAVKHTNPYSLTKFHAENWINMYAELYGITGRIYRFYNVYGGQKGAVYNFIKASFADESITIYNNGNNVRDYIYIDDVIGYIISHWAKNMKTVEVGTGIGTPTNELIELIESATKHRFRAKYYEDSPVAEDVITVAKKPVEHHTLLKEGIRNVIRDYFQR